MDAIFGFLVGGCHGYTRVPFQSLLDYIECGETLDEFLKQFPGVSREQAIAALEEAKSLVLARFTK